MQDGRPRADTDGMKKIALLAVAALVLPAAALADKPAKPEHPEHGKGAPKVTYVLKGTLTAYTAPSGTITGSVSLLVKGGNHHAKLLKSQTLTFTLDSTTKVVQHDGSVTLGDRGVVKVRAPKKLAKATDFAAQLQAVTARQVVDQGPTD
jgi:hypothetical protein